MSIINCTVPVDDQETTASEDTPKPLDVVCLGLLFRMRVATVERYPEADSGTPILSLTELVGADAAIVSVALDRLGCKVGLFSNDVGSDPEGRELLDHFGETDVVTTATLLDGVSTPFGNLCVVDREATRTWFGFLGNSVESLLAADLGLVRQADFFYVDVYPETWQAGLRAIDYAIDVQIPVLVNLSEYDEQVRRSVPHGRSVIQMSAAGPSIEQATATAQALASALAALYCSTSDGMSSSSAAEGMDWASSRDLQCTKLC